MIQLATKHDDPEMNLGWGERIGFGMASCGNGMLTGVLGSFIMIYMMNVALIDAGILSIMFGLSRLIDGLSDIVIGNLVDHTRSKMGKARVWLLRMCLPMAVSLVLVFFVPKNFPCSEELSLDAEVHLHFCHLQSGKFGFFDVHAGTVFFHDFPDDPKQRRTRHTGQHPAAFPGDRYHFDQHLLYPSSVFVQR